MPVKLKAFVINFLNLKKTHVGLKALVIQKIKIIKILITTSIIYNYFV